MENPVAVYERWKLKYEKTRDELTLVLHWYKIHRLHGEMGILQSLVLWRMMNTRGADTRRYSRVNTKGEVRRDSELPRY